MTDGARYVAAQRKTRRSLVTPEGVDLSLSLADMGQRASAFLLDLFIMLGFLIALTVVSLLGLASLGGPGIELMQMVWLLGFFLIRNAYFILLETGPRAATFGKRALGIRIVARSGGRLTADSIIARNLMREIEFFLPLSFLAYQASAGTGDGLTALFGFGWTLVFLLFPFFNRDRLRIGDLLAGTWVINAPRRKLGLDLLGVEPREAVHGFTPAQLDAYGIYELQTLEQVLRERRPKALEAVAVTIRGKIGVWDGRDEAEFLTAYYEAARAHMERNLLFGRRREHKHDRHVEGGRRI